jgi:hypothetical protein
MEVGIQQEKPTMKFQITYRLTHPEYLPSIAHTTISARTHQHLEQAISGLAKKWEERGYTLRILAVRKRLSGPHEHKKGTSSSDAAR